jgi:acetylornithine/succinyldiaminopimelate/putrescine aminotransferase
VQVKAASIPPSPDFVAEIARTFCRDHKALLVVDEIQTGVGRTGGPSPFSIMKFSLYHHPGKKVWGEESR